MKTQESRFQVHDDLTAPERSLPVLKGALAGGGQLPNFVAVLAGSPAALRAYARFRSELRQGALPLKTQQRIARAAAAPPRGGARGRVERRADPRGAHPRRAQHLLEPDHPGGRRASRRLRRGSAPPPVGVTRARRSRPSLYSP